MSGILLKTGSHRSKFLKSIPKTTITLQRAAIREVVDAPQCIADLIDAFTGYDVSIEIKLRHAFIGRGLKEGYGNWLEFRRTIHPMLTEYDCKYSIWSWTQTQGYVSSSMHFTMFMQQLRMGALKISTMRREATEGALKRILSKLNNLVE